MLYGPKKAAILLLAVGEEAASQIIQNLNEKEVQLVGYYMSQLTDIEPEDLDVVLDEFYRKISASDQSLALSLNSDFVQNTFSRAFGDDKAKQMVEGMSESSEERALESLKWLEPKAIVQFISNEHPQTIALILAHLEDVEQTGTILKLLPESIQAEVTYRMAVLEAIPPGILTEIDEVLTREMRTAGTFATAKVGGVEAVAEILNTMEKAVESRILSNIEDTNPTLAEKIRELMFTFEDLVRIDPYGIQLILSQMPHNETLLALKTASESIKNLLFDNMSTRQRDIIIDELENMGPSRISDIEAAQQKMVKICRQLEAEGKVITNRGSGAELV